MAGDSAAVIGEVVGSGCRLLARRRERPPARAAPADMFAQELLLSTPTSEAVGCVVGAVASATRVSVRLRLTAGAVPAATDTGSRRSGLSEPYIVVIPLSIPES